MRYRILNIFIALVATVGVATSTHAQHVIGVKGGWGASNARFYPKQEMRMMWGGYTGGVTWRHYTAQRYVGAVGADIEFMKRGYSYYPYFSSEDEATKALRYTRHINSVMVPIVWQPHFYLANFRLRVYIDLAATFSYNISSTYVNELQNASGTYHFKVVRDNRWNYGLAGTNFRSARATISAMATSFEIPTATRATQPMAPKIRSLRRHDAHHWTTYILRSAMGTVWARQVSSMPSNVCAKIVRVVPRNVVSKPNEKQQKRPPQPIRQSAQHCRSQVASS